MHTDLKTRAFGRGRTLLSLFKKRGSAQGQVALFQREDGVAVAFYSASAEPVLRCALLSGQTLDNSDAIRACLEPWHALGCATTVVLAPKSYQLLLVEAPDVEVAELAEALRWRIKDMVAYDVSDAVIDYFPLAEDAYHGRSRMLYVAAMERARGEALSAQVSACGLVLEKIEIPEIALLRLHRHTVIEGAGCALLGLQSPVSLINLVADGDLYLTRQVDTPKGLLAADADDVESRAGSLILDIQRSLDYYESQLGKPPCIKLLVAPLQAGETPLLGQLRYNLALEVQLLDLGELFSCDPPLGPELQQQCLVAIAGVLPEIQP